MSTWKFKQSGKSELGTRKVPFTKELYIEREDFMEEPPKKYFRMFPVMKCA